MKKGACLQAPFRGESYELAPSGLLEQSTNFVPPPPRISGGPATSVTSMAVTHLAGVADRIDRSISPCGGREERELEIVVKETLKKETATAADYCTRRPRSEFRA